MTSESNPTDLINSFVDQLSALNPGRDLAVVLIGSVARRVATSQSDLDLLVVSDRAAEIAQTADRIHVQFLLESQFLQRLRDGDDFASWCVRFGIPVLRAAVWDRIGRSPEGKLWPNWRLKTEHATRRLLLANDLLRIGDLDAAAEELTYAVSHVGRAILLKEGEFPLSRPEMIGQLAEINYSQLGRILEELSYRRMSRLQMRQAIRYVKKLLVFIDRDGFSKYLALRREAYKRKGIHVPGQLAS
jgi:uncharacterized protein (UPF0332 family)